MSVVNYEATYSVHAAVSVESDYLVQLVIYVCVYIYPMPK